MAFELREGQGTLFKNNKDGNEKRPDYRGEINVDGTVYELAAWIKEGRKGKYMSLSAKPKGERDSPNDTKREAAKAAEDFNDDIPF